MSAQLAQPSALVLEPELLTPFQLPLFVYGTLRSDRSNARALAAYSPSVVKGFASGTLHYVDYVDEEGIRRVTVALNPNEPNVAPVAGELVVFDERDELHALAALDQRELAFQNAQLQTGSRDYVYIRSLIKVVSQTGEEVLAWTYVMVSKHFKPHVKVLPNAHGIVEFAAITAEQYDTMLAELTGNESPAHPPPSLASSAPVPWRHTALLVLAIAAYFMAYLLRVAPTTMSHAITQSIGVSATGLGALAAGYSYITMAMQIPGGILADRLGPPRLLMGGCIVAAIGCCMFALADGLGIAALARMVIGLGCSVLFVTMLKVIAVLYPSRFASVTGLGMILGAAGSVCAGAPLAAFMEATSWRVVSVCTGIACTAVAAAAWHLNKANRKTAPTTEHASATANKPPLQTQIAEVLRLRTMWLCFAVNVGICGSFMGFTGLWAVPYLVATYGYSLVQASGHISAFFAAFSLSCLAIGRLADRLGNRLTLMAVGSAAFVLMLFILLETKTPSVFATYFIFIALGTFSSAFTLTWGVAKDAAAPEVSGLAIGVVNTGGFAGAAVLQQVAGWLMDVYWQGQTSESGLRSYGALEYRACLGAHVILAFCGLIAAAWLWRSSRRPTLANSVSVQEAKQHQSEEVTA